MSDASSSSSRPQTPVRDHTPLSPHSPPLAFRGSIFQNNLNIWDIAAGILIVSEAGGKINKIDITKTENIKLKASSENIYEKMLYKLDKF